MISDTENFINSDQNFQSVFSPVFSSMVRNSNYRDRVINHNFVLKIFKLVQSYSQFQPQLVPEIFLQLLNFEQVLVKGDSASHPNLNLEYCLTHLTTQTR